MSNVTRQKKAKSLQGERWKKIETPRPTLKMDYYVSNLGRLKSKSKSDGSEHILTPTPDAKDYLKSSIKLEGGSYGLYVHMAVAKYWSKKPKGEGYNRYIHKDLDRLNNKASNVVWVTDEEWRDYVRKRAKKYGYKPHRKGGKPKLSEKEVVRIKKHLAAGRMPKSKIAAKFNVSHTQINRIEAGENWAQLEVPGLEKTEAAKPAAKRGRKPAAKKAAPAKKATGTKTSAKKATGTKSTAAKKTAAKKPAAKKPAAKKPAAKKPAAKKSTAAKPAAKKAAAGKEATKPAAKRGRKPAAKKAAPAKKTTAAKSAAKKTAAKSTTAKPAAKKTTTRKPATKKTAAKPVAKKTTAKKPAAKKTAAKPAAKKPAAKKPAAKKATAAKKTTASKPAAKKTTRTRKKK